MFFFTHLFIAKVLHRHLCDRLELNQQEFLYGNIKPDLPSPTRIHHTLENCLYTVCEYSNELMEADLSTEEFAIRLGEVCHYVSDFFCYYHLNEKIHNKNLRHFFYEIRLHIELYRLHYKSAFTFPSQREPEENIHSIILEMRKSYFSQPKCLKRDIDYALFTSAWVCESIIYFNRYSTDFIKEVEQALQEFFIVEGGRL